MNSFFKSLDDEIKAFNDNNNGAKNLNWDEFRSCNFEKWLISKVTIFDFKNSYYTS